MFKELTVTAVEMTGHPLNMTQTWQDLVTMCNSMATRKMPNMIVRQAQTVLVMSHFILASQEVWKVGT